MNWIDLILFIIKNWETLIKPLLALLDIIIEESTSKQKLNKGDIEMETALFYEVINASNTSEVLNVYNVAVKNNKKYYRCKTSSGKVVGWNGNNYISAENAMLNHPELIEKIGNEVWFVNPKYVAPASTATAATPITPIAYTNYANVMPLVGTPIISTAQAQAMAAATPTYTATLNPQTSANVYEPLSIKRIKDSLDETTASFNDISNKYAEATTRITTLTNIISDKDRELAEVKEQLRLVSAQLTQLQSEDNSAKMRLDRIHESVSEFIKLCSEAKNSGK